jgi:hypothetical protein
MAHINKSRKEVSLDAQTIALLQIQAGREGRNLKNYLEQVLKEKAESFEITEEYKVMMNEMLVKQKNGKLELESWEAFKATL